MWILVHSWHDNCNTQDKSHINERNQEAMQVCDYIIDDVLRKLISTTYSNKMHILFGGLSFKNSTIKRPWL